MNGNASTHTAPEAFKVSGDSLFPQSLPLVQKEGRAMADLAESLKKLASTAPRLNQVTDAVNAAFRATEEFLESTGIGIEEWVPVSDLKSFHEKQHDDRVDDEITVEVTESLRLAYARVNGKLRIALEKWTSTEGGYDGDTEVLDETRSWDQAPRAWKLAGIVALPKLIEEIVNAAEKLVREAESAQAAVTSVLAELSTLK